MKNIKTLQKENTLLKKKLEIAQVWMKREISGQIKTIATHKIGEMTTQDKSCFLHENIDEIVTKKIQSFFGEIVLVNIPYKIIENIISAEINYYNFRYNPQSDGFAVISSYHKALDIIIEEYITYGFRKFYITNKEPVSPENDSLEKALYSVIHKKYNLSAGRLFHIIQKIKSSPSLSSRRGIVQKNLPHYLFVFNKYIQKFSFLSDILIKDEQFFELYEKIMETEVLGSKRHSGRIDFVDTREARKILIGEFKNKNCLIYKLVELGEV